LVFQGFNDAEIPAGIGIRHGKVRDILDFGDSLIIVTTDRISAFDRVLTTIPCKGQVLNEISLYWFDETGGIIRNHIMEPISPRAVRVRKCSVLPVEVVVRGYLTGSAWRDYAAGNLVSGIRLPKGMRKDQRFDEPLITPSTKAEIGLHDMPISTEQIVSSGLVPAGVWNEVERAARAVFNRASEILSARNLILVDTKYEFGLLGSDLILVDEIHTPDSSRFWYLDTYEQIFRDGGEQRKLDKEYLRQWLMDRGFSGNGDPPPIPDDVRIEIADRYVLAYEGMTGKKFLPESLSPQAQKDIILSRALGR